MAGKTLPLESILWQKANALRDQATIPDMLLAGPQTVILTEKDAARIARPPKNVFALAIRLEEWR